MDNHHYHYYLLVEDGVSEVDTDYMRTHSALPKHMAVFQRAYLSRPQILSITKVVGEGDLIRDVSLDATNALVACVRKDKPVEGFCIRLHLEHREKKTLIVAEALKDYVRPE